MAIPHQCPKCFGEGKVLDYSSNDLVTYYRCDPCGRVWAHVHALTGAQIPDSATEREEFLKRLKRR